MMLKGNAAKTNENGGDGSPVLGDDLVSCEKGAKVIDADAEAEGEAQQVGPETKDASSEPTASGVEAKVPNTTPMAGEDRSSEREPKEAQNDHLKVDGADPKCADTQQE